MEDEILSNLFRYGGEEELLQIRIQGRGGQGAQMAGQILATAFFSAGKYVQSFATYGGARRGAAVCAFIRVDDKPIRVRCDIENPDAILCFDPSLLDESLLKGVTEKTLLLVNSSRSLADFSNLSKFNIKIIDGKLIAQRNGLGRIVNSALIGAFAGLLQALDIEELKRVVAEMSPVKVDQNVSSCLEGYQLVKNGRD